MPDNTRMLDKRKKPTPEIIARLLGPESSARLARLEASLKEHYDLVRELRFPFGNNYGWGYKYSHKRKQLCYAFFEEGAFTVTLEVMDDAAPSIEKLLPALSPETQENWKKRYASGEKGGWMHFRVLSDDVIPDLFALIGVKVPPVR